MPLGHWLTGAGPRPAVLLTGGRSVRARVVVLCDAQKFGHHSMVQVGSLKAIHTLVTVALPLPSLAAALTSAGVELRKT